MERKPKIVKKLQKCITANTCSIWQQAAHTTDQLSSPSCSTRAIQKSLTLILNEKYLSFGGKKSGEWTIRLISRKMTRQSKRTRQKKT